MAILVKCHAGTPAASKFERQDWLRTLLIQGMLLAFLVLPGMVKAEEYRLAPGDVLRVMIVGNRELTLDVPIEMDGFAWFPLVGPIVAGGETLRDVRSRTAEAYVSMSLSRPVVAGSDLSEFLVESQVHVTVASYRPIYITGDVGTVHEIPYRNGMTIRHLLALASGAPPSQDTSSGLAWRD